LYVESSRIRWVGPWIQSQRPVAESGIVWSIVRTEITWSILCSHVSPMKMLDDVDVLTKVFFARTFPAPGPVGRQRRLKTSLGTGRAGRATCT
jgi:hypothetical protein